MRDSRNSLHSTGSHICEFTYAVCTFVLTATYHVRGLNVELFFVNKQLKRVVGAT